MDHPSSSPPLVSSLNWLVLSAMGLVILLAAIWGVQGRIPHMVDGNGVVLRNSDYGIYEVAGDSPGILERVFVQEGDAVAAGQPMAEFRLDALNREIAATGEALGQVGEDESLRIVLQAQLRSLTSRLEAERFIRSGQAGRVIEVLVSPGNVVKPGETLVRLESLSGNLEALVYVSALEGKKVREGMEARIVPSTMQAGRSGYLQARVSYVSPHPVTRNYLIRELGGNLRLTDWLLERGSCIEVVLELSTDISQPDGYAWSTGKPAASVESGMLVEGRVIIDQVRPITWLLMAADRE